MLVFLVHLLGCKQSIHYSHPVESNGAHVQLLSTARWRSVPGAWCLVPDQVDVCMVVRFLPLRRLRLLPPSQVSAPSSTAHCYSQSFPSLDENDEERQESRCSCRVHYV